MMRIVLDTNVLISGTFWTGTSFQIIKRIDEEKIILITSKPILKEYDKILHCDEIIDKAAYSIERIQAITKLLQKAVIVEPEQHIFAVKDDPDDNKFIEAAVAGKATHIISNDQHLLTLKQYRNINILQPEQFLKNIC